jgi:hypothetical protein
VVGVHAGVGRALDVGGIATVVGVQVGEDEREKVTRELAMQGEAEREQ